MVITEGVCVVCCCCVALCRALHAKGVLLQNHFELVEGHELGIQCCEGRGLGGECSVYPKNMETTEPLPLFVLSFFSSNWLLFSLLVAMQRFSRATKEQKKERNEDKKKHTNNTNNNM